MKTTAFRILFILLLISPIAVMAQSKSQEPKEPMKYDMDDVRMARQNGSTRSTTEYELTVASDGIDWVEVIVSDFSGDVSISLSTGRGSIKQYLYVNGYGVGYLDISKLRGGSYALTVNIDGHIYQGTVLIKTTGGR